MTVTDNQLARLSRVHAGIRDGYIDSALHWASTQPALMGALRAAEDKLDHASGDDFDSALDDLQMALVDIVQSCRNARNM